MPRLMAVLAPLTVSLVLGLWGIRREGSSWRDEAVTYEMAHRSLPDLWRTLENIDAVHGLYYVLMHALFALFDGGLVTLRLPSVLAMSAAAAGVGLLGLRLAGPRAGLLAGLAFPLVPVVQRYAQEGRSYALVCALVTWATCLLVRGASRPRKWLWAGYAALVLTASLLHELAILVLLAHGTTLLLAGVPRAAVRGWGVAAGCAVVGLIPLAAFSMRQSAQVDWIGGPDPIELLGFVVLALLGIVSARTQVSAKGPVALRTLALPLLIVPTVALLLVSIIKPLYVDRYVLYYVVGFALPTGAALDRALGRLRLRDRSGPSRARLLRRAVSLTATVVVLLGAGVFLRSPQSRVDDVTAVAHTVRESSAAGDGLLFMPSRRRVWTLVHAYEFRGLTDLALDQDPVASHTLYGTEISADRIRARMLGSRRIVAVHDPTEEPLDESAREAVKRSTLRAHFEKCSTREVTGAEITVYARPGRC
jgi:mannosyltransferase